MICILSQETLLKKFLKVTSLSKYFHAYTDTHIRTYTSTEKMLCFRDQLPVGTIYGLSNEGLESLDVSNKNY